MAVIRSPVQSLVECSPARFHRFESVLEHAFRILGVEGEEEVSVGAFGVELKSLLGERHATGLVGSVPSIVDETLGLRGAIDRIAAGNGTGLDQPLHLEVELLDG